MLKIRPSLQFDSGGLYFWQDIRVLIFYPVV